MNNVRPPPNSPPSKPENHQEIAPKQFLVNIGTFSPSTLSCRGSDPERRMSKKFVDLNGLLKLTIKTENGGQQKDSEETEPKVKNKENEEK